MAGCFCIHPKGNTFGFNRSRWRITVIAIYHCCCCYYCCTCFVIVVLLLHTYIHTVQICVATMCGCVSWCCCSSGSHDDFSLTLYSPGRSRWLCMWWMLLPSVESTWQTYPSLTGVCVHVCVFVCMYAMCVCVCAVCVCVHECVYMRQACMHVCVYVYVYSV